MRYHALATDYDGTLAHNGCVDEVTLENLKKLLATGRRLILVTGRELPELLQVFPAIELFEWVVAENGGLLYRPSTKEEKPLAEPPPPTFVEALKKRNVAPISVGRVIVATWEPHENVVLEAIRDAGLELQVIFNKGAVMILPAGVNKATGLVAALKEMGLSAHNVVGVGDAENDHAFLRLCELSAAVANALPAVKETADLITETDHGAGVAQLITHMIENDLVELDQRLQRHRLSLGTSGDEEVLLPPYGNNVLICGPSASGKSTVATRLVESLLELKYQFLLVDPEGDYEEFEGAVVLGGPKSAPAEDEIFSLLEDPSANAIVCTTGMPIQDRPPFFLNLLAQVLHMRSLTGRPHWLVLDEAHHLMPADWQPPVGMLPEQLRNVLFITVHPELLPTALLQRIDTVLAVGANAGETLARFGRTTGDFVPEFESPLLETGEILLWSRESSVPIKVRVHPCKTERRRHSRKYAAGELPPDRSFYFCGPEGKLHLRAQNLMLFLQLGDGVDDQTWLHHLKHQDYSRWFRETIKDEALASETEHIERLRGVTAAESRRLIRLAVERIYTLPGSAPLPVPGAS